MSAIRGTYGNTGDRQGDTFNKYDKGVKGYLDSNDLQQVLSSVMCSDISLEQVKMIQDEFDVDDSGNIDVSEFTIMMNYLEEEETNHENRILHVDIATQMQNAVDNSKRERLDLLCEVSNKTHSYRNLLCLQHDGIDYCPSKPKQAQDVDFNPAFAPSEMRCLALVAHDGMKATMKEFVIANKNILKKFRLTGTNSTMTMLKEVFENENSVVFGASCAPGPLGGDAELVAQMCCGRLGGMLFFKDPMDSHPHQCDIDCLCRQAEVHNTMMATTATTALMLVHTLRDALKGAGRPELIPSFFFSLQSPSVTAYKANQKKVIANHSSAVSPPSNDASVPTSNGVSTPRSAESIVESESGVVKKKTIKFKRLQKLLKSNKYANWKINEKLILQS
jgi:methylglyoxal synthase